MSPVLDPEVTVYCVVQIPPGDWLTGGGGSLLLPPPHADRPAMTRSGMAARITTLMDDKRLGMYTLTGAALCCHECSDNRDDDPVAHSRSEMEFKFRRMALTPSTQSIRRPPGPSRRTVRRLDAMLRRDAEARCPAISAYRSG